MSMVRSRLVQVALPLLVSTQLHAAECEYSISNEWGTGFTASVTIQNNTAQEIDGWSVDIEFADSTSISSMWNADLSGDNPYQASNKNYNAKISVDSQRQFGFNGQKGTQGQDAQIPSLGGICGQVEGDNKPVASATSSDLTGNIPHTVAFDATDSYSPEGENLTYYWDFGDGNSSTEVAPDYTFEQAGSYSVSLTVNDGSQDSLPLSMTVVASESQSGTAQCEFSISNEWNSGYTGQVKITNSEDASIEGWTASLYFPDGSSISGLWNGQLSGSNPYQVDNANYNSNIAPGASVQFGFNVQKAQANTDANAPELGGICGEVVISNTPPVAEASASTLSGTVPLTVSFDASGSSDADGDDLTYLWILGMEIRLQTLIQNALLLRLVTSKFRLQ